MTIFGYKVCTAKYSPKEQDDTFIPIFGFGFWTFNNPIYRSLSGRIGGFDKKRPIIGHETGLYIHVWLFSYRFDMDFHKRREK